MTKFVPYEKMSKKQQREQNALRRATWGELNPVTRKPENSKAYNRRKAQQWKKEPPTVLFVYKYMKEIDANGLSPSSETA